MHDVGQVTGAGSIQRIESNGRVTRDSRTAPDREPTDRVDRAEFSEEAQLLGKLATLPDVRIDKVAEIRAQIEAGTYETQEKLDIAVQRAVDDLLGNE